jgi:hypothetical protein
LARLKRESLPTDRFRELKAADSDEDIVKGVFVVQL